MGARVIGGQGHTLGQVEKFFQKREIAAELFLKSNQYDRVQSFVEILWSGKPFLIGALYVGDTLHGRDRAPGDRRISSGQSFGKIVCLMEILEGLCLHVTPWIIMSWKPAPDAAVESAYESRNRVTDEKKHAMAERNVAELGGVLVQYESIL